MSSEKQRYVYQETYIKVFIISDLQMTPPYGRKRRTKEPLDGSEKGDRKSWLKTEHSENEDQASGPIISWQIDGEK